MNMVPLGELMAEKVPSIDPARFDDETFELFSIPAFDANESEILKGCDIGSAKKAVNPNDVLLARIVPHIRRSWVVSQSRGHRQIASGEWIVFRSQRFHPNYLRHMLTSDPFHSSFMQTVAGVGGSLLRARPEGVKLISIPLPPLPEQKRIAAILDQADALRRLRARTLEKVNALGQAIFQEMFGANASTRKTSFERIATVRSSLDDPQKSSNQSLPHVGPEHIIGGSGHVSWSSVKSCAEDGVISGKYHFVTGDIIFSKIRPYLNKVAIADRPGMCSADMYAIFANAQIATTDFLHFVLGSDDFLRYAETVSNRANIPKMNRSQLLSYQCSVPPIEAQIEFTQRMRSLAGARLAGEGAYSRANSLFASLQHRAFRGEL